MPRLNPRQIFALARNAGFDNGQAVTMTAIALAESGGDTAVTHRNSNGSLDVGLWQINSVHGYSTASMQDPFQNARAAKAIYDSQGLNAWTVFRTGAYRRQLNPALDAMPRSGTSVQDILRGMQTLGSAAPGIAGAIPGQLAEITGAKAAFSALDLASRAGTWLTSPENLLRIVYVVLGGALVIGALVVVAAPVATPLVKTAVKAAT